jgi:hypothetical protein
MEPLCTPRCAAWLALVLLGLAAPAVRAGIDSPAWAGFDFGADELQRHPDLDRLPADMPFYPTESRRAFASSDASQFGDQGVLLWVEWTLTGDELGDRHAALFIDLDLRWLPADADQTLPLDAMVIEYFEKRGDELVFYARPMVADVWVNDLIDSSDDEGAIEIEFDLLLADPAGAHPGCRVLLQGLLLTEPSPAELRERYGLGSPDAPDSGSEVAVGCTGDIYLADSCGGCGGGDPDAEVDGGGCEGDTGGGSGCEGDTGGGGCEGDAGGGACSDAARAATRRPRPSGGLLAGLLRFLPELTGLAFIGWLRRRRRYC